MARSSASSHALIDHDEIRRWAEERGARPSAVSRTGGGDDVGIIRLDFPGYSGADSLEEISWDEWFQKFDESNLALLVQEQTAKGQTSNFNKLVSRDSTNDSANASRSQRSSRSARSGSQSAKSSSSRESDANAEDED